MSVLLIAEVSSLDATAKALSAAKKLGPVTVLVAGAGVDAAPFRITSYNVCYTKLLRP